MCNTSAKRRYFFFTLQTPLTFGSFHSFKIIFQKTSLICNFFPDFIALYVLKYIKGLEKISLQSACSCVLIPVPQHNYLLFYC